MSRVEFAERAREDLDEIWLHIARQHPGNADRFVDRLRQRCHGLADFPEAGRDRSDVRDGVRTVSVDHYLIVYFVEPTRITILRVLSGWQDQSDLG